MYNIVIVGKPAPERWNQSGF